MVDKLLRGIKRASMRINTTPARKLDILSENDAKISRKTTNRLKELPVYMTDYAKYIENNTDLSLSGTDRHIKLLSIFLEELSIQLGKNKSKILKDEILDICDEVRMTYLTSRIGQRKKSEVSDQEIRDRNRVLDNFIDYLKLDKERAQT